MQIVSKAELKTFLGLTSTANDAFLVQILPLISSRIEAFIKHTLSQPVGNADVIEYPNGGTTVLDLKIFPVASVSAIYEDSNRVFGTDTLIDAMTYYFNGRFIWRTDGGNWTSNKGAIKVVCKGGYAVKTTDDAGDLTSPANDLKYACLLQAAFMFKRRDTIGIMSASGGDGQIQTFGEINLIPDVKKLLMKYSRSIV